jgi:hypothetical protein
MPTWALLALGGAAIAVLVALLFLLRRREPSPYELGQISDQWIAQYRAHSRESER